jgi:hypothetical protein
VVWEGVGDGAIFCGAEHNPLLRRKVALEIFYALIVSFFVLTATDGYNKGSAATFISLGPNH